METAKTIYFELIETYKRREQTKHLTWEAFSFERVDAQQLSITAQQIVNKTWKVRGYYPFQVFHPNRIINAPMYIDRIVEQWFIEKYVQSVYVPKFHPNNLACQPGKGPFLSMDQIKAALVECYSLYGTDFYFYQYDIQKYFDNLRHEKAKELMSEIDPEIFWLYENVVDSFYNVDCYAVKEFPNEKFGMPKGNLPSQWTGIIYLSDADWHFANNPKCLFSTRYMDDGVSLYRKKEDCSEQHRFFENYLKQQKMGIRLHPVKTVYAPISRGFTFCGWRYTIDRDGTLHVRIKQDKKKELEIRLRRVKEAVDAGKMSLFKANQIRDGMFEYLSHGTESNHLIRYMKHMYPFPKSASTYQSPKGNGLATPL